MRPPGKRSAGRGPGALHAIAPTRLRERAGPLGQALDAYAEGSRERGSDDAGPDRANEAAAWAALAPRLEPARPRGRWREAAVAAGAAALAFAVVVAAVGARDRPADHTHAPLAKITKRIATKIPKIPAAPSAPAGEVAPTPPAMRAATSAGVPAPAARGGIAAPALREPAARAITLTGAAVAVEPGASELPGRARLVLAEPGRASARLDGEAAEIRLEEGAVTLTVAPERAGPVRVVAGPYVFVDIGTVFTVAWRQGVAELEVSAGAVEVWRASSKLAVVREGRWSSANAPAREAPASAAPARPAAPAPAPLVPVARALARPAAPAGAARAPERAVTNEHQAAPRVVVAAAPTPARAEPAPAAPARPRACAAELEGGELGRALACYEAQAAGTGLAAETALYELGRLRRDRGRDPAGALAAFAECRRRFAGGALAVEASLSIIDLLPRLGRHRDALDESARLLAAHPTLERADELRLLRGNLLRQTVGDCQAAIREYEAVRPGRSADAAAFFGAACLADLGQRDRAAQALRLYLARPDAARRDEARERLRALGR